MKYLISACLAGRACRYDGSSCGHPRLEGMVKQGEAVPFCPEEMAGLPTPRDSAEIRMIDGGKRVLTEKGEDVTEAFLRGADLSVELARKEGVTAAILKDKSPSCGFGRIYDGSFQGQRVSGRGLTADALLREGVFLFNERNFLGSEDVALQPARKQDLPELVSISTRTFREHASLQSPLGEGGPEGYDSISWLRKASSRGNLYAITRKGEILGGLFYTIKSSRAGWINRIFVRSDCQGQGVGRRVFFLLEQAFPRITEWGLDTPVWARSNQVFYQSMGYREDRKVFSREAGFDLVVLKKNKLPGRGPRPG